MSLGPYMDLDSKRAFREDIDRGDQLEDNPYLGNSEYRELYDGKLGTDNDKND